MRGEKERQPNRTFSCKPWKRAWARIEENKDVFFKVPGTGKALPARDTLLLLILEVFMGTSADLAVRYRGQTYYQHTSYDGHTHNVVAQLAATIAAAGVDALKTRMDAQGAPAGENEDNNDEVEVDRKAMGSAYLQACQARGREPVRLDEALTYEYGNPDFAHGGIIPLFAPIVDWHGWACSSIEEASFILDLDRNELVVPDWDVRSDEPNYDSGARRAAWTLPLMDLESMNPERLGRALDGMHFDREASDENRKAALQTALAQAHSGEGLGSPAPTGDVYAPRRIGAHESFSPTIHFLRGPIQGMAHLQPLVDFLRDQGDDFAPLAQAETLRLGRPNAQEQEVIVDLRAGDTDTHNLVEELFSSLAPALGWVYRCYGPGSQLLRNGARGLAVSVGYGMAPPGQAWDAGLIPEGTVALKLPAERDAIIDAFLAAGNAQAANNEMLFALIGLQGDRWRRIEASGIVRGLSGADLTRIAGLAVELSVHFERACPGSTAQRFERLSEGQRSALLEAISPLDRRTLAQLLQRGQPMRVQPKP